MKVRIDADELWPYYWMEADSQGWYEVSEKFMQRYKKHLEEFHEIQNALDSIRLQKDVKEC